MDSTLKVAMIGHKRIPSREGGVEIVVEELGSRMAEKGIRVTAYNRKGHHVALKASDEVPKAEKRFYKGIRLITVPTSQKKSLNALIYSFLASISAALGDYDVIHYHAEGPCFMMFIPKLFGKKIVATIHGLDWQRAKWGGFGSKYIKAGEKMAVKKADEIIVLSKNVQKYFMDTYQRETVYIPNGVNKPELKKPDCIKQKYDLQGEDYILFLARIVPEKGLDYLLAAYEQMLKEQPELAKFRLVIAGGSSHTDEYLKKITLKVNQLNQRYRASKACNVGFAGSGKQIVMTGFVQGQELEELYSNARLYVLPSDVEGMPLSLLEAMSYGNTCLVSNIPENREVVGDMAALFEKGNAEDLKVQLQHVLQLEKKERTYTQKYIIEKFNWDNICDRTIELYNRLLNNM